MVEYWRLLPKYLVQYHYGYGEMLTELIQNWFILRSFSLVLMIAKHVMTNTLIILIFDTYLWPTDRIADDLVGYKLYQAKSY